MRSACQRLFLLVAVILPSGHRKLCCMTCLTACVLVMFWISLSLTLIPSFFNADCRTLGLGKLSSSLNSRIRCSVDASIYTCQKQRSRCRTPCPNLWPELCYFPLLLQPLVVYYCACPFGSTRPILRLSTPSCYPPSSLQLRKPGFGLHFFLGPLQRPTFHNHESTKCAIWAPSPIWASSA